MAVFGLTAQGLKIKRLADILADLEADARATFGTSVDLDPRRPIGQFLGIQAERLSQVWELIEQVYNSSNPKFAEGKQLDEVVSLNGLVRRPATFSRVGVVVYGEFGTVVPAGTQASVEGAPESIFAIDSAITIGEGTNEEQLIEFNSVPVDGSFTLNVDGEVTAAIAYNADAATIEQRLEALNVVDQVIVTGNFVDGFTVEFTGNSGQMPWPLIEVGSNTLTSRTIHQISTVGDVASSLMNKCFRFDDIDGAVGVFFDIGNTGAPTPPALAAVTYRAIKVSTVNPNDSAGTVATKLAATLALDPAVEDAHVVSGNQVILELFDEFNLQALVDLNTTFTMSTLNIGRDVGELVLTVTDVVAGELPNGEGTATAITAGPVPAPAFSLTVLEDEVEGLDAITNPLDADEGSPIESDADLKVRRIEQFARAGRSTPTAIRSKLREVPGVKSAAVKINNTSATVDGMPPKSVKAYIQGGEPQDIAATLWDSVAAGILTVGDESELYEDEDGFFHEMSWSRPTDVPIYVQIVAQKDPENLWPSDGNQLLQQQVLAYGATLGMGSDVVPYPRLMSYLNVLSNVVEGLELYIGTSPSPTTDDRIEIDAQEIAVFDTSRITITVEDL